MCCTASWIQCACGHQQHHIKPTLIQCPNAHAGDGPCPMPWTSSLLCPYLSPDLCDACRTTIATTTTPVFRPPVTQTQPTDDEVSSDLNQRFARLAVRQLNEEDRTGSRRRGRKDDLQHVSQTVDPGYAEMAERARILATVEHAGPSGWRELRPTTEHYFFAHDPRHNTEPPTTPPPDHDQHDDTQPFYLRSPAPSPSPSPNPPHTHFARHPHPESTSCTACQTRDLVTPRPLQQCLSCPFRICHACYTSGRGTTTTTATTSHDLGASAEQLDWSSSPPSSTGRVVRFREPISDTRIFTPPPGGRGRRWSSRNRSRSRSRSRSMSRSRKESRRGVVRRTWSRGGLKRDEA